uniref:40S ribosomal protein SA C-terminal domain-containing protein n=1 Tax=Naja naja TaxID=35670 RepID=A0A8C6XDA2_NAJNA
TIPHLDLLHLLKEEDVLKFLAAGTHLGSTNVDFQMEHDVRIITISQYSIFPLPEFYSLFDHPSQPCCPEGAPGCAYLFCCWRGQEQPEVGVQEQAKTSGRPPHCSSRKRQACRPGHVATWLRQGSQRAAAAMPWCDFKAPAKVCEANK